MLHGQVGGVEDEAHRRLVVEQPSERGADRLGGVDGETALQLHHVQAVGVPVEDRALVAPCGRRASGTPGRRSSDGPAGRSRRPERAGGGRGGPRVPRRPGRRGRCCPGRPGGGLQAPMPSWPGSTATTPPATPDFAGRPTRKSQVPGAVVHAAGAHHAEDRADELGRHHLLPGHRVDAAGRQRRRHDGEVGAAHEHRALAEVDVQGEVDRRLQRAGGAHQVGERAVAVAGARLGGEHGLVEAEPAPGERRQPVEDPREAGVALPPRPARRSGSPPRSPSG